MTVSPGLSRIQDQIAPLRGELLSHPLYQQMESLDALRIFMEHHVFAVWDFMSLLKTLQQRLAPARVPWQPPADLLAVRFINEIVLGEESDEDGAGGYASHFELYLRAMRRCGAKTDSIERCLQSLCGGSSIEQALQAAEAPLAVRQFVRQTFATIEQGDLCEIASAFTFGREDLLPDVFQRIVDGLNVSASGGLTDFKFYLDRHIQLDGDHHGPMAARLMTAVCGRDDANWERAAAAAVDALQARVKLWNGMLAAIEANAKAVAI